MKQKQHYEAPWAQAFVVQPEGMICVSGEDLFNNSDPGSVGLELLLDDNLIYTL